MRTALLLVDLQNAFCRPDGSFAARGHRLEGAGAVVAACRRLLEKARRAGHEVVHVRTAIRPDAADGGVITWTLHPGIVDGGGLRAGTADVEGPPELAPRAGETVVTKNRYDPFHGTGLAAHLRARGCRRLLVAGVLANVCVDAAVRSAVSEDFEVALVADATTTTRADLLAAAIETVRLHFGRVTTTDEVLAGPEAAEPARAAGPLTVAARRLPGGAGRAVERALAGRFGELRYVERDGPLAPGDVDGAAVIVARGGDAIGAEHLARAPSLRLVQAFDPLDTFVDARRCAAAGVAVAVDTFPAEKAAAVRLLRGVLAGAGDADLRGRALVVNASGDGRALRSIGLELFLRARPFGFRLLYRAERRLPLSLERALGVAPVRPDEELEGPLVVDLDDGLPGPDLDGGAPLARAIAANVAAALAGRAPPHALAIPGETASFTRVLLGGTLVEAT